MRLYCLFLDRSDIKQGLQTILTGIAQIKDGVSMCIFPEGTRNTNASELDLLPFHEGSLKMAEKTRLSHHSYGNQQFCPGTGSPHALDPLCHVTLEYGKPIYPKELSREEKKFWVPTARHRFLKCLRKIRHHKLFLN